MNYALLNEIERKEQKLMQVTKKRLDREKMAKLFIDDFNEWMALTLKENNISSERLAKELKVSEYTVDSWLSFGRPSLQNLEKLIKYFNISPTYILSFKPQKFDFTVSPYHPSERWKFRLCEKLEKLSKREKRDVLMAAEDIKNALVRKKHYEKVIDENLEIILERVEQYGK